MCCVCVITYYQLATKYTNKSSQIAMNNTLVGRRHDNMCFVTHRQEQKHIKHLHFYSISFTTSSKNVKMRSFGAPGPKEKVFTCSFTLFACLHKEKTCTCAFVHCFWALKAQPGTHIKNNKLHFAFMLKGVKGSWGKRSRGGSLDYGES